MAILDRVSDSSISRLFPWIFAGWSVFCFGIIAQAQPIPDTSLGGEQSRLEPQVGQTDHITGGVIRGSQLFHSFADFSVAEGRSLYFTHSDPITHIFSRVTGNDPSRIDGTLGVLGTANLFLLNPNGILFGPRAQLDLAGSLHAATAEWVQIGEMTFSAIAPQASEEIAPIAPSLLQLDIQPGIQLGRITPNSLIRNNAQLSVSPTQQIVLTSDHIEQAGGMIAPAGRIELQGESISLTGRVDTRSALGHSGTLQLTSPGDLAIHPMAPLANYAVNQAMLTNAVTVEAKGNLTLQGSLLNPSDSSLTLIAGKNLTWLSAADPAILGGSLSLSAGDEMRLNHSIGLNGDQPQPLNIQAGRNIMLLDMQLRNDSGQQQIDNVPALVSVQARNLMLQNSALGSGTSGAWNGADIVLNIENRVVLNNSHLMSTAEGWATGNTGDIDLKARYLRLESSQLGEISTLSTATDDFANGNAGDIILNVADSIELIGNQPGSFAISDLSTPELLQLTSTITGISTAAFGTGISGNIVIQTGRLDLRDRAAIGIVPGIGDNAVNQTGDITVRADEVQLQGFALLGSITPSSADAGNVMIHSNQLVLDQGAFISTNSFPLLGGSAGNIGNAGEIDIHAHDLKILNGSLIFAGTDSGGAGGAIRIDADRVSIIGMNANRISPSAVQTTVGAEAEFLDSEAATGAGGTIEINAGQLNILDGGQITASSSSRGDAGNIKINANQTLVSGRGFSGIPSLIAAQSSGSGAAGQLNLKANQLIVEEGAILTTQSQQGDGGAIHLTLDEVLLLRQQSQISATAGQAGTLGNGGDIKIVADFVISPLTDNSDITANAFGGMGGNVEITTLKNLGIEPRSQPTQRSDITASSALGVDGMVEVDQRTVVEPSQGIAELPQRLLDRTDKIIGICEQSSRSRFALIGRGGIPSDPRYQLLGQYLLEDRRTFPNQHRQLEQSFSIDQLHQTYALSVLDSVNSRDTREASGLRITADDQVQLIVENETAWKSTSQQLLCSRLTSH